MSDSTSSPPRLTELERRDSDLIVRWDDGSDQVITYETLRYWCPCANCKPRRETDERCEALRTEVGSRRNEKPKAELVGDYGIRFTFATGCNSGIYSTERLHAIATGDPAPDSL